MLGTGLGLHKNNMLAPFNPLRVDGNILWSKASIEEKDNWQRETFQLDNEVLIDGLTKDLQYPLFSGADNNLERVTLDSTITLDCTVGWRLSFYVLGNGDWLSGGGFGVAGNSNSALGYIRISTNGIIVINDGTNGRPVPSSMLTQKKYKIDIVCDGVNFVVYIDDELSATNSITTLTTINVNIIGNVAGYEAQGLLYDIKINDVDDSENWTHHYTGINGDWSDQIKKNQKALFQIDGDKVDLDTSILLDSSVGFRVQFYIKESNLTNSSGVLGQDDKNGSGIWFNDIPELRLNDGVNEVTLTHNLSVNTNHLVDIICDTVNIELYVDSVLVDTQPIGSLGVLTIDAIGEGRNIITTGNLWGVKINNLNHTDSWTDQYDGINSDWNNKISSNNGTAGVSLDQTYPIPEDSDNIGFDIDGYPIRELPYYNHGTAGANLKYIKNNHNNLKAKTGGYYVSSLATGDSISIPEITLGEDFTYHIRCELILSVTTSNNVIGKDGSNAHRIWQRNASSVANWRIRINSVTYDFASIPQGDGEWVDVVITRSGTTTKMYLNGVLHDTITTSDASILIDAISKFNTAYYNGNIKDLALFNTALTASQVANLYNNPQRFVELSREYGAERIYDFNIGNGEVGYPVWDLSGNDQHGTIQSNLAPAGTNFIYNDAEVGTQQVLESRNVYRWFNTNGATGVNLNSSIILAGDFDISLKLLTNIFDLNPSGRRLLSNASNSDAIFYDAIGRLSIRLDKVNRVFTTKVLELGVLNNVRVQRVGGEMTATINDQLAGTVSSAFPLEISAIGYARSGNNNRTDGIISNININNQAAYKGYGTTPWKDEVGTNNGSETGTFGALFIPESPTKGIDLFGNAITNQWKQGLLNFTGLDLIDNAHGGVEFGDQVDTLDVVDGRVIAFAFTFNATDTNQYFVSSKTTGTGFILQYQPSTGAMQLIDNNGTNRTTNDAVSNILVEGQEYFALIHQTPTTTDFYVGLLDTEITAASKTASVSGIGVGSRVPIIGIRGDLTYSLASITSSPICFDKSSITLTEINNIRKYLKSLIS